MAKFWTSISAREQPPLARGARDRHPAERMGARVVEELQVVLGPREIEQGLEAGREVGVRQTVELVTRLLTPRARSHRVAGDRLAEAQDSGCRGDQGCIPDGARGRERLRSHLDRSLEVQLVEPVDGELDLEDGRLRRRAVRQLLPGAGEARMGLVVTPQPVLDGGDRRGQLHLLKRALGGQQVDRLEQERAGSLELPERGQRRGEGDANSDLPLAVGLGEEAQRLLVPARRGGRGAARPPRLRRRAATSIAASSPWRADCATWWARSAAGAPRSASESAARACAARRRPAGTVRTRPAAPADGGRRRASGPTCHARDPVRAARRARPVPRPPAARRRRPRDRDRRARPRRPRRSAVPARWA